MPPRSHVVSPSGLREAVGTGRDGSCSQLGSWLPWQSSHKGSELALYSAQQHQACKAAHGPPYGAPNNFVPGALGTHPPAAGASRGQERQHPQQETCLAAPWSLSQKLSTRAAFGCQQRGDPIKTATKHLSPG